ncbi:hypothetical protein [Roseibium sp.]|uniref:hypothetical protein n=1 Tax=Roseibium sp. TaxID=1936156 RepID=UPI003A98756D
MIRVVVFLLSFLLAAPAFAADGPKPVLRMDFPEATAVPGQALTLRVTVLVSTWMPKPPVFPSFEVPNVLVRLPSRASNPTSERVDGETWSGITRAYRLYPLVPGQFQIPAQTLRLTYADPETREAIETTLETDAISFQGQVPVGGEELSPFIAATSLSVSQTIDGAPEDMVPGSAVTRRLKISASGVPMMAVPPMLGGNTQPGLSSYISEPVITETENRGVLSGTREEAVTYVAEAGGRFHIPPITLDWFNLKSGQVETIHVEGIDFAVRADTPPKIDTPVDWRQWAITAVLFLAIGVALMALARWAAPRLRTTLRNWRAERRASETFAYKAALSALRRRDFDTSVKSLRLWKERTQIDEPDWHAVESGLAVLGKSLYGTSTAPSDRSAWEGLQQSVRDTRSRLRQQRRTAASSRLLPPLNPERPA